MNFIDRRLNPKGKSLGNRQRFLRRVRAQIKRGGAEGPQATASPTSPRATRSRFRRDGIARAALPPDRGGRAARARAARQQGLRAGRPDREAARRRRRPRQAAAAPDGEGEDDFSSSCAATSSSTSSSRTSSCPIWSSARLKEIDVDQARGAPASPCPARRPISISSAPCATRFGRRLALKRPEAPTRSRRCEEADRRRSRRELRPGEQRELAELQADAAKLAAPAQGGAVSSIRSTCASTPSSSSPSRPPSGHVLPDGRVGLDGRAREGSRQALLHAAAPVPEAALQAGRHRLHPPHPRGAGGGRGDVLLLARDGRHVVSTALERCSEIIAERYTPADWNIYAAQASDGDNARRRLRALRRAAGRRADADSASISPISRSRRARRKRFLTSEAAAPSCGAPIAASPRRGRTSPTKRIAKPARHLPGLPRTVRREQAEAAERMTLTQRQAALRPRRLDLRDARSRLRGDRGHRASTSSELDVYPNQIEIISSEQMLDAYSSLGMPLMYHHWSFGKLFVRDEALYRRGPSRARLRDRHQLEPVHLLLHGRELDDDADAGHRPRRLRPQPLLQEQLSVPAMDRRRGHSRLSRLRQALHRALRGALRPLRRSSGCSTPRMR